jgi:hypothetical protein
MKTRAFVYTNWEMNSEEVFEKNKSQIRYICWGNEICPKTKKKHEQGLVYFFNPRSFGARNLKKISDLFGGGCHIEPKRS